MADPIMDVFLELRSKQSPEVQRQMDEDMADAQEQRFERTLTENKK